MLHSNSTIIEWQALAAARKAVSDQAGLLQSLTAAARSASGLFCPSRPAPPARSPRSRPQQQEPSPKPLAPQPAELPGLQAQPPRPMHQAPEHITDSATPTAVKSDSARQGVASAAPQANTALEARVVCGHALAAVSPAHPAPACEPALGQPWGGHEHAGAVSVPHTSRSSAAVWPLLPLAGQHKVAADWGGGQGGPTSIAAAAPTDTSAALTMHVAAAACIAAYSATGNIAEASQLAVLAKVDAEEQTLSSGKGGKPSHSHGGHSKPAASVPAGASEVSGGQLPQSQNEQPQGRVPCQVPHAIPPGTSKALAIATPPKAGIARPERTTVDSAEPVDIRHTTELPTEQKGVVVPTDDMPVLSLTQPVHQAPETALQPITDRPAATAAVGQVTSGGAPLDQGGGKPAAGLPGELVVHTALQVGDATIHKALSLRTADQHSPPGCLLGTFEAPVPAMAASLGDAGKLDVRGHDWMQLLPAAAAGTSPPTASNVAAAQQVGPVVLASVSSHDQQLGRSPKRARLSSGGKDTGPGSSGYSRASPTKLQDSAPGSGEHPHSNDDGLADVFAALAG
jgi:hypothetical protein